MAQLWKVVGGADHGGIVVRTERALTSAAEESRLATDAIVKEIEFNDGRLNYELVSGSGPAKGWVSATLRGKALLVKENRNSTMAEVVVKSEEQPSEEEKEAFRQYAEKFAEARNGLQEGYNRRAFPWAVNVPKTGTTPAEAVEAAKAFKGGNGRSQKKELKPRLSEVDSDGEDVPMCAQCHLPVGEVAYRSQEGGDACLHAECMAQVIAKEGQLEEERRMKREKANKLKSRMEYEIGWRAETVPKNAAIAERLGCSPLPQGLCCLVFDELARTVKIAATHEPAASVNLEYLMLALKVRKDKCREPLFSLDPVDTKNIEKSPQVKRYEPEWLAGTSVGDVMFQADYFLKELALGEYDMPVVGMLSVFDWSEQQDKFEKWAAREWFVVKKAEVRMAQDKTLIPHVKMGVEAREQVVGKDGLEDKAVTRPNHPCKKFAEAFTRNFDLIAERKSVLYHLRELAKASVMAKFLVDSHAKVDNTWYELADELVKTTKPEAHPQIPNLWNMRGNSRIQLKNGRLVDMATGGTTSMQAIYGGVQFGLDKFELAQRASLQGSQMMAPKMQGMQMGSRQPMFMPQRFQLGQRGETPQGVDLNLDSFSLTSPERMNGNLPPCSASLDSLEGRVTLGRAFLSSLQQGACPGLKPEHHQLLKKIFNPAISDRTEEGAAFVPPDPNLEYIGKVRNLVNEEQLTLSRRKMLFCDKGFMADNAGPEFPSAWTSRFQVESEGRTQASSRHALVQVEADPAFQKFLMDEVLPSAAPEFAKPTEDGTMFRVYRIGSLEIRTTQERQSQETIGAVFSRSAPSWQLQSGKQAKEVGQAEEVTKAKVYVEAKEADKLHVGSSSSLCRYYVVLETAASNVVVTELLSNGSVSWAVNPDRLEDRNSLARLLFTIDCKETLADGIKKLQAKPWRTSKAYAKAIFELTAGSGFRGKWGGYVKRYASSSTTPTFYTRGTGKSTDYVNGMWTARKTTK
eukprot:TRINITY_DN4638_c0_g5_i1.p1 TRINITY_DN4638_c0_g5~~TRINITY_DN4638_c0_g5_i1.p1  ORF type:complete len:990 (-),score=227.90 TRINITY_DN4638_c0_g5_i1:39-2951(-)